MKVVGFILLALGSVLALFVIAVASRLLDDPASPRSWVVPVAAALAGALVAVGLFLCLYEGLP